MIGTVIRYGIKVICFATSEEGAERDSACSTKRKMSLAVVAAGAWEPRALLQKVPTGAVDPHTPR
jgi:hypothetical protein